MSLPDAIAEPLASATNIEPITATVVSVDEKGGVVIANESTDPQPARLAAKCAEAGYLQTGDEVVALVCNDGHTVVVLDRLNARGVESALLSGERESAYVTIEADRSLTLHCGNASITLRKDGKIVLRGTEVVSRASRRNRIRGATVSIN